MYCPHCSAEIKDSDAFCSECGNKKVSENQQQSKESSPDGEPQTNPKPNKGKIIGGCALLAIIIGVVLFFSLRTTYLEIPDFVGLSEEEAIDLIEDVGLIVGDIIREYSERVNEGLVISQSLRRGQQVERGAAIDLTISLGMDPNLASLEEDEYIGEVDLIDNDYTPEQEELDEHFFEFEYSLDDFGIANRSLGTVTMLETASLENGEGNVYDVPSIIGIEIVRLVENSFFQDTIQQMGFSFTYGAGHSPVLPDGANTFRGTAQFRAEVQQSEAWTPIITNREYSAAIFALAVNTPTGPEIHIALLEIKDYDVISLSITLSYSRLTDEGRAILGELSEVFGKDLFGLIDPLLQELNAVAVVPPPPPPTPPPTGAGTPPSVGSNLIDVPDDPEQLSLLNSFLEEFAIIYVEITGSQGMHMIMPSLSIESAVSLEVFYQVTGQYFDLFDTLLNVVPLWEAYQELTPSELAEFRSLLASQ